MRENSPKNSGGSDFSRNKKQRNALVSLELMEDYCKQENIFFSDEQKAQYLIQQSKRQYKTFRNTINKACNHFKDIADHPDHLKLLEEEQKVQ